jgi:hypothetical protein
MVVAVILSTIPAFAKTGMVEMLNLTGARQVAMGETTALFDSDPYNLEFNPAAIGDLPKGRIGFSHNSFIQNRSTNTLAIIFPAKGAEFGVHLRLSSIGDIEARGNSPTSDPLYLFNAYNFSLKLFSSLRISPRLRAGISAGWLMEKIDSYRASSGAIGLGAVYSLRDDLNLHGSAVNLGPKFGYGHEDQELPSIYRLGASYHRKQLTISADYLNIKSGESRFHFGSEYLIREVLFLRAGYQTGYDSRGFSAGAGFVYRDFRIDYAFVPYKSNLGNSHRFTFNIALR